MTLKIHRRNLLRGIASGLVSVPALSAMYGGRAVAAAGAPRRLIIYWTPNGTVHNRFWPKAGEPLASNTILEPLAAHQDDLILVKTTYGGTGDHKFGTPFSTTGRAKVIGEEGAGISIDQEIAAAIGSETLRSSLVLAGQTKEERQGFISANADGSRNPPIRDPWQAFEFMFGPYQGGAVPEGPTDLVARQSILDAVMSDIGDLRMRVAGSERAKLDAHLEAIRELEKGIGGVPVDCQLGNTIPPETSHDYEQRITLHADVIAAAFACDLTRVVSFMTAPAGHDNCNFGFLGVTGGDIHQSIAHSATYDAEDNDASAQMVKVHTYHAEGLAYLIDKLKQIPEGDGTVFDSTTILWTNECAWGNHGHTPIPVVLAGSMGGFLKTGQYIPEALDGTKEYRSILTTLAHGMGHPIPTFGEEDPSGVADILLA